MAVLRVLPLFLFFLSFAPSYARDLSKYTSVDYSRNFPVLNNFQGNSRNFLQHSLPVSARQAKLGYSLGPSLDERDNPVWVAPSYKLEPWFKKNSEKIELLCKNQFSSKGLRNVSVEFILGDDGTILSPSIVGNSGSNDVNNLALHLVRDVSPLSAPLEAMQKLRLMIVFNYPSVEMFLDLRSVDRVDNKHNDPKFISKPKE